MDYQTIIYLGCGSSPDIDAYLKMAEKVWLVDADANTIDQLRETWEGTPNLYIHESFIAADEGRVTFYHYNLSWASGIKPIDEATQRVYPGLKCLKKTEQPTESISLLVDKIAAAQGQHLLIMDLEEQNEQLLHVLEEKDQLARFCFVVVQSAQQINVPASIYGPVLPPDNLSINSASQVFARHPVLTELLDIRAKLRQSEVLRESSSREATGLLKENKGLLLKLEESLEKQEEANQELEQRQKAIDELQQKIVVQTNQGAELQLELDGLHQRLADSQQEQEKLRIQVQKLQDTREKLQEQLNKADSQKANLTQELDTARQQQEKLLVQSREWNQAREKLDKQCTHLTQELDKAQRQVEDALGQNHRNFEAKNAAESRVIELEKELHRLRELHKAKQEQEQDHGQQPDNFYRAFEDKFRGSRDEIKRRVKVYLPFVTLVAARYPNLLALDLGCGRGEWLEVLQEAGISAEGVDKDLSMLAGKHAEALQLHHGDALDFLQQQPDASRICISLMHVVEHLPFDTVRSIVVEAKRVLVPEGILIMETPNPENIMVGSCNFYMDPTHKNPIPPALLAYVPEYYGFKQIKILRLQERVSDSKTHYDVKDLLISVSPDYAVVARPNLLEEERIDENERTVWSKNYGVSLSHMLERNASENIN